MIAPEIPEQKHRPEMSWLLEIGGGLADRE